MIEEYWHIQNAEPDANQSYNGNSQGYVPAVRDAINARAKRVLKLLFPANNKHVDGISTDGKAPNTQLCLLEHYIRQTNLKAIVRTDLIAGDVTGQWNLMVDWTTSTRRVTKLVRRNPLVQQIGGEESTELDVEDPTQDEEATETEDVTDAGPEIVDFATSDLAVLPPTCNDLQKAKAVIVRMRLSKEAVQNMVDAGDFILPDGMDVDDFFQPEAREERRDPPRQRAFEAGVKVDGTDRHALIYMAYTRLDLGGKHREEAIVYFAGEEEILGIIANPLWSGKRPIISEPVDRVQGSFFGRSKIEPVKFLQWNLTDFWNMGQDSATYSLLPIWAVDPLKTPQWAQLTMGLAAIWPVSPTDVKPLTTPALWKDAVAICEAIKAQIRESLDVNEMMMGITPPGRKNNALIGGMQQEQSTSISDHASRYEDEVLNPLLEMLFEFDQQFRTDAITIQQQGEIGVEAKLQSVPVPQWDEKYFFRWTGTEFSLGLQRLQQQIAWMNVLKGIPPQLLNGRTLDVTPILVAGTENLFGPEMAPRILVDQRNQFTVSADIENEMIHNGFDVGTHPADDDQAHLQSHMKAAGTVGDPAGLFRGHMGAHMQQLQQKRQMQMVQSGQMPGGPPGAPGVVGGPGGGPGTAPPQGVAGTPRPGSLPAPGRPVQNPAGAINADQMADPAVPGRG